MLFKQQLAMNLSMKCFPAQKINYVIKTEIPNNPNAAEKNHYLFIFNSMSLRFAVKNLYPPIMIQIQRLRN